MTLNSLLNISISDNRCIPLQQTLRHIGDEGREKNSITRMELLCTDVSPSYMKNMNIEKKPHGNLAHNHSLQLFRKEDGCKAGE